ncbi:hypothetical protein HYH03_017015 [Edaphochlamys debaryana]|uniref:Uncharacterized protein n=1 Tax=Edaphochlamys debaryana TaxID=47281 RepID=A0A835XJU4_9CHLO|nr:hypothetical protein HYH03_017015 [Edaphochlamys debaryana]|eukprot:KAG2484133.1 hypothetical protein HYH03_017015 [Edaphochlamys debaryana]
MAAPSIRFPIAKSNTDTRWRVVHMYDVDCRTPSAPAVPSRLTDCEHGTEGSCFYADLATVKCFRWLGAAVPPSAPPPPLPIPAVPANGCQSCMVLTVFTDFGMDHPAFPQGACDLVAIAANTLLSSGTDGLPAKYASMCPHMPPSPQSQPPGGLGAKPPSSTPPASSAVRVTRPFTCDAVLSTTQIRVCGGVDDRGALVQLIGSASDCLRTGEVTKLWDYISGVMQNGTGLAEVLRSSYNMDYDYEVSGSLKSFKLSFYACGMKQHIGELNLTTSEGFDEFTRRELVSPPPQFPAADGEYNLDSPPEAGGDAPPMPQRPPPRPQPKPQPRPLPRPPVPRRPQPPPRPPTPAPRGAHR